MIRWSRRVLLLGWIGVGIAMAAPACSNPTAPRLPEVEEPVDSVPPDEG